MRFLSTFYTAGQVDWASLLLRITFGGLMLVQHGWGKAIKLLTGDPTKFADPIGLGAPISLGLTVFAEFGCAFLIVVGLLTRLATIPLIITMFVAAVIIHGADPLGDKELCLVYLVAYIAILLVGPGRLSLDYLFNSNRVI